MLHKETVAQSTLELLINLQSKEYFTGFHLVGGTALALNMGHRKSIDLDLFSNFDFDAGYILENLSTDFSFNLYFSANNTLKGSINDVQIDILAHRYPLIAPPDSIENVSLLSVKDLIAMKLNAISISGQRVKDFIDIYFLLDEYSISDMLGFYKLKYTQFNEVNILKSLTYFDDVNITNWPVILKEPLLNWKKVKKRIIDSVKTSLNLM